MFKSVQLLCFFGLAVCSLSVLAQNDQDLGFTRFDEHTVYHSVFSSTAIKPDIAAIHGLTRAGNQMLINVALVSNERQFGGEPARVSGTVSNLLQQQRELKFKTIDEGDVVYYLAPVRVTDRETLHFSLRVEPANGAPTYDVKLTKRVYVNK